MTKNVEPDAVSDAEFKAKEKRIKAEEERLRKQFADISEKKREVVEASIKDAAFCAVQLEDLRENINRYGVETYYQNGNAQFGTKQSPSAELYIKMSQRLDAATKTLLSCMPKDRVETASDGFDSFVDGRE